MTSVFSARRRADEFEALVSRTPDGSPSQRDGPYAPLLTVVEELRNAPPVEARPEFVSSLREQLLAEADSVLLPGTQHRLALPPRSRRRDRRVAALLGGVVAVGATATVAVASQTALPGESLYPVKRGLESAEVRLASGDAARGEVLMANAERRLVELEALSAEGGARADALIPDTIDDFTAQADQGARLVLGDDTSSAGAQQVRVFTGASMDRLADLEPALPSSSRDELTRAARRLTAIDEEAVSACPTCSGGVTEVPEILLSAVATDLLSGLDRDAAQLGPSPVSGQDLRGIVVPEGLQGPGTQPSSPGAPAPGPGLPAPGSPTPGLPLPSPALPGPTLPGPTRPSPVLPSPEDLEKGVKDLGDKTKQGLNDGVNDVTDLLNDLTGGQLGGLTGSVNDLTGGLTGGLP